MQNFNPYGYPYNNNNYNQNNQQQQLKQYAFVNGIEGAKAFQIPPNQTMMLMDSDKPVVFMKTTDGLGKASLRYFNLTEIDETEATKIYMPKPIPEYALKSDIENLNSKIDTLIDSLNINNKSKEELDNG